jgi:plasmid stabilization system protein ParE
MKRYRVILHPEAEADIASSYEWGSRVWGEKRAKGWVRDLQRTIRTRLTSLPLSCPLAQESDDLDREIDSWWCNAIAFCSLSKGRR